VTFDSIVQSDSPPPINECCQIKSKLLHLISDAASGSMHTGANQTWPLPSTEPSDRADAQLSVAMMIINRPPPVVFGHGHHVELDFGNGGRYSGPCSNSPLSMTPFAAATPPGMGWCSWGLKRPGSTSVQTFLFTSLMSVSPVSGRTGSAISRKRRAGSILNSSAALVPLAAPRNRCARYRGGRHLRRCCDTSRARTELQHSGRDSTPRILEPFTIG
jgi:hypothetical protein